MFLIPTNAAVRMLEPLIADPMWLRLFANDVQPNGDNHVEADGYIPRSLSVDGWRRFGDAAAFYHEEQSFEGPLPKVYGYYVCRQSDNELLFIERFEEGPYVLGKSATLAITPTLMLKGLGNG